MRVVLDEEDEAKVELVVASRRMLIKIGVVKSGGTGIQDTPPMVDITAAEPTMLL